MAILSYGGRVGSPDFQSVFQGVLGWTKIARGSAGYGDDTTLYGRSIQLPDAKWEGGFERLSYSGSQFVQFGIYGNNLKLDSSSKLKSGTVTALYQESTDGIDSIFMLTDVRISASSIAAAARTSSGSDDWAIVVNALSGDDYIVVDSSSMNGRGGNDLISGTDDAEVIFGGRDEDLLLAGGDTDWLKGESGNDVLFGQGGRDKLSGGSGNDTLDGGTGNDRLWGGSGRDVFLFDDSFGRDVIRDFQDGRDRIALIDAWSMADVTIVSLGKGRSRIDVDGGGSIEVNVSKGRLSKADFVFANKAIDLEENGVTTFLDQWDYA